MYMNLFSCNTNLIYIHNQNSHFDRPLLNTCLGALIVNISLILTNVLSSYCGIYKLYIQTKSIVFEPMQIQDKLQEEFFIKFKYHVSTRVERKNNRYVGRFFFCGMAPSNPSVWVNFDFDHFLQNIFFHKSPKKLKIPSWKNVVIQNFKQKILPPQGKIFCHTFSQMMLLDIKKL